jgi:predicted PP-loop superfamily ATPase
MYELPEDPSCIVVSVSGGVDSDASALWARQRWPDHPIILWHSLLAGMDWDETEEHLDLLCESLGNSKRVTVQGVSNWFLVKLPLPDSPRPAYVAFMT